ncbi:MAG: hypothetical protein AB7Q42_07715 [Acidimicrobiia bacterium]
MSVRVWRMWSSRNAVASAVMMIGLVLAAAGVGRRTGGLVVLGAVVAVVGALYRARAVHDYWVTCRFRPSTNIIIVEPTHPLFDAAARALFLRALG